MREVQLIPSSSELTLLEDNSSMVLTPDKVM